MVNKFVEGIQFSVLQSFVVRILGNIVQLSLIFFLLPAEFAVLGILTAALNLVSVTQQFGVVDVLINRQKSFRLWRPYASSLAIILSIISFVGICLFGLIYSIINSDYVQYIPLFIIVGVSEVFRSLTLLPIAESRIELTFKKFSKITIIRSLIHSISIIIFLLLNLKAYSVAYAYLVSGVITYYIWWKSSSLKPQFTLKLKRVKFIIGRSLLGLTFSINERFKENGDYLIVGGLFPPEILGIYYMAYLIASQITYLFIGNIDSLLFPYLSVDKKRWDKFPKVITLIILIITPVNLIIFLFIEDLLVLINKIEYMDSISLIRILLFAMTLRAMGALWHIPLKLLENYKIIAKISFISMIIYLSGMLLVTNLKLPIEYLAYWVLIYNSIFFTTFQIYTIKKIANNFILLTKTNVEISFILVILSTLFFTNFYCSLSFLYNLLLSTLYIMLYILYLFFYRRNLINYLLMILKKQ